MKSIAEKTLSALPLLLYLKNSATNGGVLHGEERSLVLPALTALKRAGLRWAPIHCLTYPRRSAPAARKSISGKAAAKSGVIKPLWPSDFVRANTTQ